MKKVAYDVYVFLYIVGIFCYIVPGALYELAKNYPAQKADEFRNKRLKYYEK